MGWRPANARSLPDGPQPGPRICARRHRAARPDAASVHRRLWRRARRYLLWGASLELQTPLYFLRYGSSSDTGVKLAAFADAGSLWNYVGPTTFPATGEVISGSLCSTPPFPVDNAMHVRSSVGVGFDLGLAIWSARIRLFVPAEQGTLRPGAAVPLRWRGEILIRPARGRDRASNNSANGLRRAAAPAEGALGMHARP